MGQSGDEGNLGIYLKDHLAGATGGLALAKRGRKNSTDPARIRTWDSVANEVEQDREVLLTVMRRLDVSKSRLKAGISWVAEKAGRFKLNGQLTGPSDLGQYFELEMMFLGITGKLSLWTALKAIDDPRLRDIDFAGLIERAESQRQRLDRHRIDMARSIFPGHVDEAADSEQPKPRGG